MKPDDHDIAQKVELAKGLAEAGWLQEPEVQSLLQRAWGLHDPAALSTLQKLVKIGGILRELLQDPGYPHITLENRLASDIPIGMQPNGVPYGLAVDELVRNLLIVGITGGAKTTVLIAIVMALLAMKDGPRMLVLSVKHDFSWMSRLPNVLTLTADDLRLGFFSPAPIPPGEDAVQVRIQNNSKIISQTHALLLAGQLVTSALQHECLAGFFRGSTYLPPTGSEFLEFLRRSAPRFTRGSFDYDFYHRLIERWTNLVQVFPKTFEARQGFRLGEFLERTHVCLELSAQAMETETLLLVLVWVLNDLYLYRSSHGMRSRVPKVLVIVDEAEFLFGVKREEAAGDDTIISRILRRGREFGINFIVAAQRPRDIAQYLKSNCQGVMVMGGLQSNDDKEEFCRSTGFNSREVYQYLGRMRPFDGLIRDPRWPNPITVQVTPPDIDKHVPVREIRERAAERLRELGIPTEEASGAVRVAPQEPGAIAQPTPEEWAYLLNVHEHPEASVAERQALMLISRDAELQVRTSLQQMGFLESVPVPRKGRGRREVRVVLTPHFYKAFGIASPHTQGKGRTLHKILQGEVARHFTRQGYTTEIEKNVNGKSVDVLLTKPGERPTACEIATTHKSEVGNVLKDLLVAEVGSVIIACVDSRVLFRVRAQVSHLDAHLRSRVQVDLISKYLPAKEHHS